MAVLQRYVVVLCLLVSSFISCDSLQNWFVPFQFAITFYKIFGFPLEATLSRFLIICLPFEDVIMKENQHLRAISYKRMFNQHQNAICVSVRQTQVVHYKDSARLAGFAATKAETLKCQKYHDLQSNYHLQPVAIETTCVYGKSTAPFLSSLAKKLDVSDDPRECQWLHQHVPGCGQGKCCQHIGLCASLI